MKNKYLLVAISFIIIVCSFLVSCPGMSKNNRWIRGSEIHFYPRWLRHTNFEVFANSPAYGVSDWIDWQSEQAKQFHTLVPDTVISDAFQWKFRLVLIGQDTTIVFNDEQRTSYIMFFNWVHKVNSPTLTMTIPQKNEEQKYEYDCHIKTNLRESETNDNKGRIL